VTKRKKHEPWTGAWFLELAIIIAVALGLALGIQAFIVKPYRIPSESMEPTLNVNQRVLVNRLGNRFGDPEIGDILVFHPPKGAETDTCGDSQGPDRNAPCSLPTKQRSDVNYIKRVVAGPGDKLSIQDGHVILNGERQKEDFIKPCPPGNSNCTFDGTITIPADHWFMMGDNRGESDDSRFWGPVPRDWIIGGAFATYWPPKRIGFL
jgi:signal peptidase I